MKKKDRAKVRELSLLENPNQETQVKDKAFKVFVRVTIITLLFALLIFGYAIKFSVNSYTTFFGIKFTGTVNAKQFYKAKNCDLIVAKPYEKITDIDIGDIICYATNLEKGSGEVVSYRGGVFEIKTNDEMKRISQNSIVGKQVNTIRFIGVLVEFIGSYYGIITFNAILIGYVLYLTFSRINYENTAKGIYLYNKFKQLKEEEKERAKAIRKLGGVETISLEVIELISGDYNQNVNNIIKFKNEEKISLKDKYKYILNLLHDNYLPKKELSKEEKKHITSLIELMCVAGDIDSDIEYMITDLILKTKLVSFDVKSFNKSVIDFLSLNLDDDDLLNLGSILYVLIYNNAKYRKDLEQIVNVFLQKAQYSDRPERDVVFKVALSMVNMIKI